MKKLVVKDINDDIYTLEKGNKLMKRTIYFEGAIVEIGDIIYCSNNELSHKMPYRFGPIIKNAEVKYSIKIVKKDKEIYLTRYFG